MAEKPEWKPGEIVVEFAGKKNQYFTMKSLAMRLRGRWVTSNVRREAVRTNFTLHPDIPGIYVCLDIKSKTIRLIDPLEWDEYKDTLEDANRVRGTYFNKGRAWPTTVKEDLTAPEIKSILGEVLEREKGGDLVVHHGEIPGKQAVLERKGKLRVRYGTPLEGEDYYATEEEMEKLKGTVPTLQPTPLVPEMK
jgi:hypothetical protein